MVHAKDVGTAALARMVRDGTLAPAGHRTFFAADVPLTPGLRAHSFARCIVPGSALTGLTALWVYGYRNDGPPPYIVDVCVTRGNNPDAPLACRTHGWRYVTDSHAARAAARLGGVPVVPPAAAAAGAFARDPWGEGVHAAVWALRHGAHTADVGEYLARLPSTARKAAILAAWATVSSHIGTPGPADAGAGWRGPSRY